MFSRDEMQRAIEDALKSMEGVALELYRRGREEAREELEEARERNTDLRKMLEQTARALNHAEEAMVRLETQRDEARAAIATCPDCVMYAKRNARLAEQADQLQRERDEWRDKFHASNQTTGELCDACGWSFKIPGEPCRCEVVRERDEARADAERYLTDLRRCASEPYEHAKERADAFRRGAEAMREACIGYAHKIGFHGLTVDLRALPNPEEP